MNAKLINAILIVCVSLLHIASSSWAWTNMEQQLSHNSQFAFSSDAYWIAQSVTVKGRYLYRVEILVYGNDTDAYGAILEVRGATNSGDNPNPSQTTVLRTVSMPVLSGSGYLFRAFDFSDDPIDISAYNADTGQGRLMFTIKRTAGKSGIFRYQNSNVYAGGSAYIYSYSPSTYDLPFKVYTSDINLQPPTSGTVIDQQQPLHNSQTAFSGFVAQTVSPLRNFLYSVDLVLYAASTYNPTVTLEIRGADQNYPGPSETVLLGSVTKTLSGTGYNWQTFDFSASPIDISNYNTSQGAGRIMLLARTAAGSVNNIVRWQSSVSTYPQGELFLAGNDNRYNGDMAFKVWTSGVDYTQMTCGDSGTVYHPTDLNMDCRVDLLDWTILSQNWMDCIDPENSNCD